MCDCLGKKAKRFASGCGCGFTLIEVVAGMFLLAAMLAAVTVAFHRTTESVIEKSFEERAGAVAQRRLELLIASGQEPNTISLRGRDEFDPVFLWEISLSREVVGAGSPRDDLSNTIIKAVVKVASDSESGDPELDVQMVRYFASLLPLPGFDVAVPLVPEQEEAPWYIELRERLGREPTIEETLEEMVKLMELPPELLTLEAEEGDEEGDEEGEDEGLLEEEEEDEELEELEEE